ncbi:MAG: nucleoside recognition domain-containing protein [Bacteroidales bacterium]
MTLHYIWAAFFLIAAVLTTIKTVFWGETTAFPVLVKALFDAAKVSIDISIGLIGILTLWLGLLKIAEKGGIVTVLSKLINPFFSRIFPELPKNHPAFGHIIMNYSAIMLGLDNAATPLGLKAMESLQEVNSEKEKASNAQIMFLVLNTAGFTIIPMSIIMYRAQCGAANPTDIFIPILISSFTAFLSGLIVVSIVQRIKLYNPVVLAYLISMIASVFFLVWYFSQLSKEQISTISSIASSAIILFIITSFIILGLIRKVNLFSTFVDGAKEGFNVAIKIIPYLVGMLCGIAVFRSCGALNYLTDGIGGLIGLTGVDTSFVEALPTALMKPLSGSGSRGLMLEAMNTYGADSFVGRLVSIFQGATDTTFYIIALYFGSVGIKNTRYAIPCGLVADAAGIIMAIFMGYIFFF